MLKNGRFIIALSFVDFIVKSLFQCNFPISSFMLWLKEVISSLSGQLSKKKKTHQAQDFLQQFSRQRQLFLKGRKSSQSNLPTESHRDFHICPVRGIIPFLLLLTSAHSLSFSCYQKWLVKHHAGKCQRKQDRDEKLDYRAYGLMK